MLTLSYTRTPVFSKTYSCGTFGCTSAVPTRKYEVTQQIPHAVPLADWANIIAWPRYSPSILSNV